MSHPSFSSQAARTDRTASRLAVLAPGGGTRVFEGELTDVSALDGFAVIASESPTTPPGFKLAAKKQHRRADTLGAFVHRQWRKLPLPPRWQLAANRLCRMTGVSSVVGDRLTYVPVPGFYEYYYVRTGAPGPSAGWRSWVMDLLMTSGWLGHLPVVGATAASAVVSAVALGFSFIAPPTWWIPTMIGVASVATVICALGERWAQRYYVAHDPREVVLDEVAGMALALALSGPHPLAVAAAFFAFRFFDILKVGVRWIEKRNLPGGIVWDDVLAGLYAGALVLAVSTWWLR
jgi:phosphatidylglycerophosphatase A